jgi:hypothetical protein
MMDTPIYHRGMRLQTKASRDAKTRGEFLAAVLMFLFPLSPIKGAPKLPRDPNL